MSFGADGDVQSWRASREDTAPADGYDIRFFERSARDHDGGDGSEEG